MRKTKTGEIHRTLDSSTEPAQYWTPKEAYSCLEILQVSGGDLRCAQYLLHHGPNLQMHEDTVANIVCFEGLEKDNHSSVLRTRQSSLQCLKFCYLSFVLVSPTLPSFQFSFKLQILLENRSHSLPATLLRISLPRGTKEQERLVGKEIR